MNDRGIFNPMSRAGDPGSSSGLLHVSSVELMQYNTDSQSSYVSGSPSPSTPNTPASSAPYYGESSHSLAGDSERNICAVCGDRASGKHYGAYSCEGCKGFFKRTIRKDIKYVCREDRYCVVNKRQRNRCQYCRYQKCITVGMRRESVQEERKRKRQRAENKGGSGRGNDVVYESNGDNGRGSSESDQNQLAPHSGGVGSVGTAFMSLDDIMMAENAMERLLVENRARIPFDTDHEAWALVLWAKQLPHFSMLPIRDQTVLLTSAWNEMMIINASFRSVPFKDVIVLPNRYSLNRIKAQDAGIEVLFDRILIDMVDKLRYCNIERIEVSCLRGIILLNPDARGVTNKRQVEQLRDQIYYLLDKFCRTRFPDDLGRFAKLLLRLPSLRSIGLMCADQGPCASVIVAQPQFSCREIVDRLST